MRPLVSLLGTALVSGCSLFGIRSGYEQPPYEVIDRIDGGIEIRRYGSRLVAETVVAAPDAEAAQNAAFEILAGYIFGANRTRAQIAMTAPVAVDAPSARIAMTAPVETAPAGGGRYTMRFFLPSRYTLETAPVPADSRVGLLIVPPATVAVLRFAGSGDDTDVGARKGDLVAALNDSPWRPSGPPAALFYDPPWTIPWLRRNEVAVPVAARG